MIPQNKDEFVFLVKSIEQKAGYKKPKAFGIALLDRGQLNKNKVLQASFALVNYEQNYGFGALMLECFLKKGELDFSKSEFVGLLSEEDLDFALSCCAPFKGEEDTLI